MEHPDMNSTRLTDVSGTSSDIESTIEKAELRLTQFLKLVNAKSTSELTSGKLNNKLNKPDLASELYQMSKQLETCIKTLKI